MLDDRPVEPFVLAALPRGRCLVLEVGAGRGLLAAGLRRAGHQVVAIDPATVPGAGVVPVPLEAHRPVERYDAVVASRVLHHLTDLEVGLAHLGALLRPGGRMVVNEFAPDRLDTPTAAWLLDRWRRVACDNRGRRPPAHPAAVLESWHTELAGLHGAGVLLPALRARFTESGSALTPHLADEYLDGDGRAAEVAAIRAGSIRALGYRWVGIRR